VLLLLPGDVVLLTPPGGGGAGLLSGVWSWHPASVPVHCEGEVDGDAEGAVLLCARAGAALSSRPAAMAAKERLFCTGMIRISMMLAYGNRFGCRLKANLRKGREFLTSARLRKVQLGSIFAKTAPQRPLVRAGRQL
jgi:hypothetical protein